MRPHETTFDGTDMISADRKPFRNFKMWNSIAAHLADCFNLCLRQSRLRMVFSNSTILAMLGTHVIGVILARSKKQMSRIATRRIVTVMANAKTIWNFFLIGDYPRDTMRFNVRLSTVSLPTKVAIPRPQLSSNPRPASIGTAGSVNLAQESFNGGFCESVKRFTSHCNKWVFCFVQRARAALRACFEVRAFTFPRPALPPKRPRATACLFFMHSINHNRLRMAS
jgi:hypothetical protein